VDVLSVRNLGAMQSEMRSTVNILNADALVIEQLRNNGDIYIANLTGDIVLDNTNNQPFVFENTNAVEQGGVINAGTTGGTLVLKLPNGNVFALNRLDALNPDIIADVAFFDFPKGTSKSFGDRNRKILMYIPSVYNQTAKTSSVRWYKSRRPVKILDSSKALNELDNMVNDQLIQIEGLNEIDPAIFTSVSNYIHDEVAILMPADQRFDDDEYAE
jgi:hypothetical protein